MTKFWIFVFALVITTAAVTANFSALELNDQGLTLFGQILGTLLMLSVVLERALDVLLSIARAEESGKLKATVDERQKIVDAAIEQNAEGLQTAVEQLETAKTERARFRAKTMRLAMVAGLVAGVVISALGFRVLETLIKSESLYKDCGFQCKTFQFVDIFITGAVLAGGSDAIHKLIEVYRNFADRGTS